MVCYHISEFYYQSMRLRTGAGASCRRSSSRRGGGRTATANGSVTDTLSASSSTISSAVSPTSKVLVSGSAPNGFRISSGTWTRAAAWPNGRWLGGQLTERPSTVFKTSGWCPTRKTTIGMVEKLGTTECLLMGSDWPHAEGLREPADFYTRVEGLGGENRRLFLRENGINLIAGT